MLIPRRAVRTSQPQHPVRIDWSHPDTRGLRVALNGATPGKALVGGAVTQIGAIGKKPASKGVYQEFNGTNQALSIPLDLTNASGVTILALLNIKSYPNGYPMFWEFTTDGLGTPGGFSVYNDVDGAGLNVGIYAGGPDATRFAAPSLGEHVICTTFDPSQPAGYRGGLFIDGVKKAVTSIYTGGASGSFGNSTLYIGARAGNALWVNNDLAGLLLFDRTLSEEEIKRVSASLWQLFEDEEEFVFRSLAGGSSLNASGTGSAQSTGTASLAAQVQLVAVGVSVAGGSASGKASIPLSAAGFSVVGGSATAKATITVTASGIAQAAGQAGLSVSVLLAGAGAAQAAGNASLAAQLNALAAGAAQASGTANLTGGAAGALSASGGDVSSGSAVLAVTIGLQATGGNVASGTANGQVSSPGAVSAAGGVQSAGSAIASARIDITEAGFVHAMGAGVWTVEVPISAFGGGLSSGSGVLSLVPDISIEAVAEFLPSVVRKSMLVAASRRLILRV